MELLARLGLKPDAFAGQTAVVTGAAKGIGEQVARGLGALGANVILLDIDERGEEVAAQIRGNRRAAEFAKVDLRDLDALDRFQRETLARRGRVDILANNAAWIRVASFGEVTLETWEDMHRTTVRASTFLIQKFLPGMRSAGSGIICNTVAVEVLSNAAFFAATMASQRSMVLSLAGEIGTGAGISVLGFAPGYVDTPLVRSKSADIHRLTGMPHEEWINRFVRNPGYEGHGFDRLMPAEHCGASYVYCLAHAPAYHGQIADAFHPLINHGIITPAEGESEPEAEDPRNLQIHDYIHSVSNLNRNLEQRIVERTRDLEEANRRLAEQNQRIEDLSGKLSRYLPRQVYDQIFAGRIDTTLASRRCQLTVFFSDIRDFTRSTERLEPEALSEILNTYFTEMTEIARAHGATIDKFVGDAILMFFGDPETEGPERDAEKCVAMALAMQRRMGEIAPKFLRLGLAAPLEMRVGINSGYCTVGNFGSFERMDYTIIGTPVNIAARLQDAAPPGGVLVSSATRALVAGRFSFAPAGSLELKGIGEPVKAFSVLDANGDAAPATPEAGLTALKEQLGQLDLATLGAEEREELMRTMARLLGRDE